jgi:catechol 2,3-dioxygenase-like lactoylglutathione lyase family enzyme
MAIKRLDHVSLLTKDPGPVLDFYRGRLGFELGRKREFPELKMAIYDLKARGEFLELIVPLGESAQTEGLKHIAFLSDSIDEDFAAFKAGGASLVYDSVQRHGDCAFFFVKAPGGHLVEVIEYL